MNRNIVWGTVIVIVSFVAVAAMATAKASAQANYYTCIYAKNGLNITIDGADNSPIMCRAFNGGAHMTRVYYQSGRLYCTFRNNVYAIRVRVRASSSYRGHVFCGYMKTHFSRADGWYEIING